MWHAVAQLVVFLRYKPEMYGVDSRCCPAALWTVVYSVSKIFVGELQSSGA